MGLETPGSRTTGSTEGNRRGPGWGRPRGGSRWNSVRQLLIHAGIDIARRESNDNATDARGQYSVPATQGLRVEIHARRPRPLLCFDRYYEAARRSLTKARNKRRVGSKKSSRNLLDSRGGFHQSNDLTVTQLAKVGVERADSTKFSRLVQNDDLVNLGTEALDSSGCGDGNGNNYF
jgi:hypothetical protein